MDEAAFVVKFNPESPDYRPAEDPFPPPREQDGEIRYDLVRPPLPRRSQGANQAVPDTNNFRKMSVYVRGGTVVRVVEDIDVVGRLDDLAELYDADLPTDKPPRELAAIVIDVINVLRRGQGNEPIQIRTMSAEISDVGKTLRTEIPRAAVRGSLPPFKGASGVQGGAPPVVRPDQVAVPDGTAPGAGRPLSSSSGGVGAVARAVGVVETPRPAPAKPVSAATVGVWLIAVPLVLVPAGFLFLRLRGPEELRA
jgi:hypothetical protein